ncbi:MAG: AI-2E family transporter [Myxococcaceae bacterium]|nr:AI-2E family transporter [Myxococcaceae bacterium]
MPNSRLTLAVFLVLLLSTLYLLVDLFWIFITPIVLGLVLVSIFYPLYESVLLVCRGRKYIAASFVLLLIILGVSLPFSFFVSQLSQQAFEFYQSKNVNNLLGSSLSDFSSQHPLIAQIRLLASQIGIDLPAEKIVESVSQLMSSFGGMLYDRLSELASNALLIAFNLVITMLIVFTFLVSGTELKKYIMELSPLPEEEKEYLVRQFSEICKAVFVGNGLVGLLEGILGGLGFHWFHLGPGIFWGVVLGLSAFLPVIGSWIVILPATLILMSKGQNDQAWLYFLYNLTYLGLCELVLKPRLIGGKSRVHIVLVLLSVLGGVHLFGVLGLFYGPLVVTMFLTLIEIYKEHYRDHLAP